MIHPETIVTIKSVPSKFFAGFVGCEAKARGYHGAADPEYQLYDLMTPHVGKSLYLKPEHVTVKP